MEYDLVVVGGGAAGFSAVTAAAEVGARVLLISQGPLGGTCVNYGCVPTKYMLSRLSIASKTGAKISLKELLWEARRISLSIRRDRYELLLDRLGIDYIKGRARFKAKGIVEVDGKEFKYKSVVIAVGAKTWRPPIEGLNSVEDKVLDNERLFTLDVEPSRVVIIGGRAQGVEIAQIMARSGVEVVLLQRSPRLLPDEEPEVGLFLRDILVDDGVKVFTGVSVRGVKRIGEEIKIYYEVGGVEHVERADYIYLATGRKPLLDGLGLDKIGVKVSPSGFIVVDDYLKAAEGVYAAGDCINGYMLESVAAREGYVAALNALGASIKMDYSVVPRAVFTDPEFARVGMTEKELAEKNWSVRL